MMNMKILRQKMLVCLRGMVIESLLPLALLLIFAISILALGFLFRCF